MPTAKTTPPASWRWERSGEGWKGKERRTEPQQSGPVTMRLRNKDTSAGLCDEVWAEHDGTLKRAALVRDTFCENSKVLKRHICL